MTRILGDISESRSTEQRRIDAIAVLDQQGDAWPATARRAGVPSLIAVSAAWTGTELVIATRGASPTARNLDETARARVALGSPADVVMLDVTVDGTTPATKDAGEIATTFREAVGWDPSEEGSDWRYFRLRPTRIQAYRGYGDQAGRDVMREGRWLPDPGDPAGQQSARRACWPSSADQPRAASRSGSDTNRGAGVGSDGPD